MKRLIVVLLAGIMVFGLAGCGASGSDIAVHFRIIERYHPFHISTDRFV